MMMSNISTLYASTYLGGNADEKSLGLAVDDSNNVFIGGFTHSGDYPFTSGVYDSTFGGVIDVIVAKLLMESSVGIEDEDAYLQSFRLYQNYPNPFNPNTIINYKLPEETNVQLVIYNSLGEEVRKLVNVNQRAGIHSAVWDGKNNGGQALPSGVYIYTIKTAELNYSKKMILMK
jgi:hypothetical protein